MGVIGPQATSASVGNLNRDTEHLGTTSLPPAKSRRGRPAGQNSAPAPPRARLVDVKTLECERRPSLSFVVNDTHK
jgi:hypothetical protein